MQENGTSEPDPLPVSRSGIVLAEGFGLRLYVRRGVLHVEDGVGPNGRRVRLIRSTSRDKRVVLLGRAGSVSVEALRWMAEAEVGFALIDAARGRVVASIETVTPNIPMLRRQQARAVDAPVGLAVAKYLIGVKLAGQHRVLEEHFPDAIDAAGFVSFCRTRLEAATSINEVTVLESEAALRYWGCWWDEPIEFARKDRDRVPPHWRQFGPRSSPITQGPRSAASPGNALINLLNAYGELEAKLACHVAGLDPALAVVHHDQQARDSLALDAIEVIRPDIEEYALNLIRGRVFPKSDFYETSRGVMRVGTDLARSLTETLPTWRRLLAPHVEEIARIIASSSERRIRVTSRLTQRSRSAAQDGRRDGPRRVVVPRERVTQACPFCGSVVEAGRRVCDECLGEFREEQGATLSRSGPEAVRRLRAAGDDPAKRPENRRKVGEANARRVAEQRAWDSEHARPDPEVFRSEILPAIKGVSLNRLARATGLSLQYVGKVRRGLLVPHPRHWEALRALVGPEP